MTTPPRRITALLAALTVAGAGLTGCSTEPAPTAQITVTGAGLQVTFPPEVDEAALPEAIPDGGQGARQGDGSVLVLDRESRLVAAYLTPEPPDTARLETSGSAVRAVLRSPAEDRTEPVTVTVGQADTLIASATWITRDDGLTSLRVTPAETGRRFASPAAMDAGWRQVLDAVPDADTPGMKEQYMCHVQFAPKKEGWYLEPWRPAGSYFETVAARCNRGPQSDPEL